MKNITIVFGWIFTVLLFSHRVVAAPSAFEFQDNRIIIQVMINGQGPFHMMLDTGATNILSNEVAGVLGLRQYDRFPVSGGGENTLYASYCDVQSLEITDHILGGSRFICMGVSDMQKAIGFPHLDGLIGYEIFSQFLTEIHFDKMEISLRSFSERKQPVSGDSVVALSFQGPMPVVDAIIDGIPGKFWLDTGDRASATLSLPFIQQNFLREKYRPQFSMMTGYGLGGPMKTFLAFASELTLGGLEFSKTLIRLPDMKSQGLNDPASAGTLGMGLLRQFNLVFDYSRNEMILSRNKVFEQDRSLDRSGMWIAPAQGSFLVMDVLQQGPAWNAGIRAGDRILLVNGVEVSKVSVFQLREQLKDPRQRRVDLSLRQGRQTKQVSVYLRDLL